MRHVFRLYVRKASAETLFVEVASSYARTCAS